jgi:hypothetical protein
MYDGEIVREEDLMSFEDELKRFLVIVIFIAIGAIGGMINLFIHYFMYSNGTITYDRWIGTGLVLSIIIIIISFIVPIIYIVITDIKNKLKRRAFERDQALLDTFEGEIKTQYRKFVYQIQTPIGAFAKETSLPQLFSILKHLQEKGIIVSEEFAKDIRNLLNLPETVTITFEEKEKQIITPIKILQKVQEMIKQSNMSKEELEKLVIRHGNKNDPSSVILDYKGWEKLNYVIKGSNFHVGYRNIISIKNLDDPQFSPYNVVNVHDEWGNVRPMKKYEDSMLNCTGFAYIITNEEHEFFDFHEALSNDSNQVKVRKVNMKWDLVTWLVKDEIPLLISKSIPNSEKLDALCVGFESLKDGTIHSLVNLYASESKSNEPLENTQIFVEAENKDLKEQMDQRVTDKMEQMLYGYSPKQPEKETKVEMKKFDVTTLVFSLMFLGVGLLVGYGIWG